MKTTTAILAATAAAFFLTSSPTLAAEPQPTQTQTKRCYRHVHKLPFRVRVPCRKAKAMKTEPVKPAPSEPAPQPAPEKKP